MVETGGARRDDNGNLGGHLVGGQVKTEQEGHPVGDGSGDSGGRWVEGQRCGDGDRRRPGGRRTPCSGSGGCGRLGLGAEKGGRGATREAGKAEVEVLNDGYITISNGA